MTIQAKKALVSVAIVASGSLIGVFFASHFVAGSGLLGRYSFGDALRDWIILSAGAVTGGVLFSWASKR